MAVKLFLDNILLLDIYRFKGFLNRHKNDEMVNNYSNSCNYVAPAELKAAFWTYQDELSEVDGILLKGEKILIPQSLRSDMLNRIHSTHLGGLC